jgi:hypothetical protein
VFTVVTLLNRQLTLSDGREIKHTLTIVLVDSSNVYRKSSVLLAAFLFSTDARISPICCSLSSDWLKL